MSYTKKDLDWAVEEGLISEAEKDRLVAALDERQREKSVFDLAHVAYYLGAFIVMSALGWFMNEAWERFGGLGLFFIAVGYGLAFLWIGCRLWSSNRVPAGLLITLAVWMTPLAVFGLEKHFGIWPGDSPENYRGYYTWIKSSWIGMELATLAAGLLALKYFRFPFLVFPLAFSLWFLSMDLAPFLFGNEDLLWNQRLWVSLAVGFLMLVVAFYLDRRTQADYSFWLYLFGMLAFWGGLSLLYGTNEVHKALYALVNLILIALSPILKRAVFAVFGAIGIFAYLSYLAHDLFKDSLLFPLALSAIGLMIFYLGILNQRYHKKIEKFFEQKLPHWLIKR